MRIVGGNYRSRKLAEFKGDAIRPTADSVRESLFNILRNRVEGCDFLDLYCGTGAVGLEALSRGANSVTFNDLSRESLAVLKKNLEILKINGGVTVKNSDAATFLAGMKDVPEERKFDNIYRSAVPCGRDKRVATRGFGSKKKRRGDLRKRKAVFGNGGRA